MIGVTDVMFISEIIHFNGNQSTTGKYTSTYTNILKRKFVVPLQGIKHPNMPLECMVTHVNFRPLIRTLFNIETNLVMFRLKLKIAIIPSNYFLRDYRKYTVFPRKIILTFYILVYCI